MAIAAQAQRCGVAASLDVVGDRWALLIVREVFFGHHRFSEIARATSAPSDRLAARLRDLVEAGILERREYQQSPPRADYHLTPAGTDLVPVLLSLFEWGNRWGGPSVEPMARHHDHELSVHPVCTTCGEDVRAAEVTRKPGVFDWDPVESLAPRLAVTGTRHTGGHYGQWTDVSERAMELHGDTHQKALRINLDPRWYGTLAEIGAGQEVARWFFQVGGAAGTVAKSISAYDMAVSDAVYGKSDRYVSMGRLQAMLDYEYKLNIERLDETRGDAASFFAFADTVVARSYKGGNECHGWMGVKFQAHPRDEPSQIILHIRMLDIEAALQQEAIGVVGVNLLHGAFFEHHEPDQLIESLLDRLTTDRIEIDMIEFKGIEFRSVDNRLMALKLVQLGLSGVAMFGADRTVLQPSEALRKKAILVERGSFRPPTHVNLDMLASALEKFKADVAVEGREVLTLTELTMRNLLAGGADVDRRDFLARADLLSACGETVLISDYVDYYRLAAYIGARTDQRIGMVMGVPSLIDLFDEANHAHLPGGILESFGRLFKNDLKLFVYPVQKTADEPLTTIHNVEVDPDLQPLYDYLARRGSFVDLDNYNPEYLHIFSRDVLHRIAIGDNAWESMVPAEVAELIKKRSFFGYRDQSRD